MKSLSFRLDTGNNVSSDIKNGVESDYEVLDYLSRDNKTRAFMLKIFKLRCDYRYRIVEKNNSFDKSICYPIIKSINYCGVLLKTLYAYITGNHITVKPEKEPFAYALIGLINNSGS